mmetsp:Transcript_20649/g.55749  ORF Transcript_20649/g.55749 Transcript_20649/m.55749 type:complete len:501 (+) Transcript_20649:111-1613(+)
MCNPAGNAGDADAPLHVVVAGAGPAGALAALQLLCRNKGITSRRSYRVTLVDGGRNFGLLSEEELKKNHRSWMIGLASHGIDALRTVPGLWEKYVSHVGVNLTSFALHLGSKEMKFSDPNDIGENYIVDRNFVTAAVARYLHEHFVDDEAFEACYNTKVQYVDGPNKRVLIRGEDGVERYVHYDYILGCDGVRSAVRAAFAQHERTFEMELSDIFTSFKAIHVPRPAGVDAASLHLLPDCMPTMNGIALPETGDMINLSAGVYNHLSCHPDMLSEDYKVVSAYMKKNFKAFELIDWDDAARQWVGQQWNTTGQVHCNFYHSARMSALLLGDAAHATSPSIGMGMNTALKDAACLKELLDEHGDDWEAVLPAFSRERVKEGNSLTWLAYYLFSFDASQQLRIMLGLMVRTKLSKIFPSFVRPDPNQMIGRSEHKLSAVYDTATKIGLLARVRAHNDRVRREHFERKTGMVTGEKAWSWNSVFAVVVVAVAAAGAGAAAMLR